ncbi:MAG: hypothetical protein JW874_00875 [Spirochaetales bacterium]|nr:hypothetical protein [Spirochaetales bacterium]
MKKTLSLAFCLMTVLFVSACRETRVPENIQSIEIFEKESPESDTRLWSFTISDPEIIATFTGDLRYSRHQAEVNAPYYVLLKPQKKKRMLFQTDGSWFKILDNHRKPVFFYLEEALSIESLKKSSLKSE